MREPTEPELDDEARELVRAFASISNPETRISILRMANALAGDGAELR